ncbi:MAG: LanC-like protein [Rubrivivax sp.]|nr:LanC-like protein [Rubrivivax sp.]
MLYQPDRHEPLRDEDVQGWDEDRARICIADIVRDTEARFRPGQGWPMHALDIGPGDDPEAGNPSLYFGTCGVLWALHFLRSRGAADLERDWPVDAAALVQRTRDWLRDDAQRERAAYLMGETPVWLLAHARSGSVMAADRLAELIEGNIEHPGRELMWGSPGTLLAALFMHQRTGQERFADLFRRTAAALWSQLEWSEAYRCRFWTQALYGQVSSYMDAVHGFVGTALPLIRGRHLLIGSDWERWKECIANSVRRSATLEGARGSGGAHVNWIPWLLLDAAQRERWNAHPRWLLQYCHGSPGFVINLADFPGTELDDLLLAAGETTWAAGPLLKGSNLCHGTGGNGYAFLKLFKRTGDERWLQRARAFAMYGIRQTQLHAAQYGCMRYSLWTGDLGFAVYLWDCIKGEAEFPTLDVF